VWSYKAITSVVGVELGEFGEVHRQDWRYWKGKGECYVCYGGGEELAS
jgi:hypothetical protein